LCLAHQSPQIQRAAIGSLPDAPLPAYARARTSEEITALLERARRDGYVVFHPIGHREASLAVPIRFDGALVACIVLRYMLVAEGGLADHAQRLRALRALCEKITSAAQARAAAGPSPGGLRGPPAAGR
jgi:DNA-binding IclR family transcriptional regulator